MQTKLIDGKAIAARLLAETREQIAKLGFTPGLGVILVGDDPASKLYVGLKEKACAAAGIKMQILPFPENAKESEVITAITELNRRDDIDAILVQLPLPLGLDEDLVIAAMDPAKDVDGFHPTNLAAFQRGAPSMPPGLVAGILELIDAAGEDVTGKKAAVVANSGTFFVPVARALENVGVTAVFARPDNPRLAQMTRAADILIVAVGRPKFITGEMCRPGAIVIDVGTNKLDGKTVGDVDAVSVDGVAAHLSPVPGGVGPMTVAMLIANTAALAKRLRGGRTL